MDSITLVEVRRKRQNSRPDVVAGLRGVLKEGLEISGLETTSSSAQKKKFQRIYPGLADGMADSTGQSPGSSRGETTLCFIALALRYWFLSSLTRSNTPPIEPLAEN